MVMALSVEADTSLKLRLRTSWRMLVIQTEDYEITFFTSISCLGLQANHGTQTMYTVQIRQTGKGEQ